MDRKRYFKCTLESDQTLIGNICIPENVVSQRPMMKSQKFGNQKFKIKFIGPEMYFDEIVAGNDLYVNEKDIQIL